MLPQGVGIPVLSRHLVPLMKTPLFLVRLYASCLAAVNGAVAGVSSSRRRTAASHFSSGSLHADYHKTIQGFVPGF